jgi:hypothetical protein
MFCVKMPSESTPPWKPKGHVWTAPAVQEESDLSAKRSGAAMYPASHDGISVKS